MFWGSSSSWASSSSGGLSRSSSSLGTAVSNIIRSCPSYYVSWMMVMILVSSSLVVQRSESFLLIPTTTTILSSRHHAPVIQHNHGHYSYFDNVICSSNHYYSVRCHVGSTSLSSVNQQSTNEEKEKSTTKTRRKNRSWEESYQLLVSYKEQHGNCNVPAKYKDDRRLGIWVNNQRSRKDRLRDDSCIAKLDAMGFTWSFRDEKWDEMFEKVKEYKTKHGHCNVPIKYKDDHHLGRWVVNQRQQKEKDKLSDERIAKLNDLKFSWSYEIFEEQWEEMFEKLVQYAKENNGDCNIPGNYDNINVNKELCMWMGVQRLRKSILSKERRTRLDNLGFIWEDSNKLKADHKWNEQYQRLKEYKQNYGHCRVPIRWKDDRSLGLWVNNQRQDYRKGLLRLDRQMKLEEMSFTWKARDTVVGADGSTIDLKWFGMYGRLLNFQKEHGHCDVPKRYKKDKSLGKWVYNQRRYRKRDQKLISSLRHDRKEMLDEIGFRWSFDDYKDEEWRKKYEELKSFKEQNRHLRIPKGNLECWVYRQRVLFAAGKVQQERKDLLDEIEFRWEIDR